MITMKKAAVILFTAMIVFSLSACGMIRNKVVSQLKSVVAAAASALPGDTDAAEETAAPDDSASPEETAAPEDTVSPEETAAEQTAQPDETAAEGNPSDSTSWIEGIPSYVPVFQYGTYVSDQETKIEAGDGTSYGMCFEKVSKKDMEAYAGILKKAGFEIVSSEAGGTFTIVGGLKQDGVSVATVMISWSSENSTCNFVVIALVSKK
jgi:hypothetical protein